VSWDALGNLDPVPEQETTWGDWAKLPAQTVTGIGAGAAGLARSVATAGDSPNAAAFFKGLQSVSRKAGEDIEGSMTEMGRHRANLSVTDPEFWENPGANTMMKIVGASPYVVAGGLPGLIIKETAAALGATIAATGTLAAGDVTEEIQSRIDKASTEDLKKQSPLFRAMLEEKGEAGAREEFSQQMLGWKPLIAFGLGASLGAYGPAANLVRGVKGVGRPGIGKAAIGGAAEEAVEEGYGGTAAQTAEIQGGARTDYDPSQIMSRAATGALVGGVMGGATGIGGGKKKSKDGVEVVDVGMPDAATQSALSAVSGATNPLAINQQRGEAAVDEVMRQTAQPPVTAQQTAEEVLGQSSQPPPARVGLNPVTPLSGQQGQDAALDVLGQSSRPPPTALQQGAGAAADVLGQSSQAPATPLQQGAGAAAGVLSQSSAPPTGAPPTTMGPGSQLPPIPQSNVPGAARPPLAQDNVAPPPGPVASNTNVPGGVPQDNVSGAVPQNNDPTAAGGVPQDNIVPSKGKFAPHILAQLKARGLHDVEIAQLTPSQAEFSIKTFPIVSSEQAAPVAPAAPTATPAAPPAPAAAKPAAPAAKAAPVAEKAAPPAPPAEKPAAEARPSVILQSQTPQSKINAIKTRQRTRTTVSKAVKADKIATENAGLETKAGKGHGSQAKKAAQDKAAAHVQSLLDTVHEQHTVPETPEAREALALKLQTVLDDAAAKGHVLREDIDEYVRKTASYAAGHVKTRELTKEEKAAFLHSIPKQVTHPTTPKQVTYLRELADVRDALLADDFGPNSPTYPMVKGFIEDHNLKNLQGIFDRRRERAKAIEEQRKGKGGGKAKANQADSTAKRTEGVVLGDNQKAALAPDILQRQADEEAERQRVKEELFGAKPLTPPPPAKPEGADVVKAHLKKQADAAQKRSDEKAAKQAPANEGIPFMITASMKQQLMARDFSAAQISELTPAQAHEILKHPHVEKPKAEAPPVEAEVEAAPESGRVRFKTDDIKKLLGKAHPRVVSATRIRNDLRKWVNSLSDEAYNNISPETIEALRTETNEKILNEIAEEINFNPDTKAAPQKTNLADRNAADTADAATKLRAATAAARAAEAKPKPTREELEKRVQELLGKAPPKLESADPRAQQSVRSEEPTDTGISGTDEEWLAVRDRHGSDLQYVVDELYEPDAIVYSDSTAEVLRRLDFSHLGELPQYIQNFARKRLTEILEHVPLHIIETKVNESMHAEDFAKTGKLPAGFYDPNIQRDHSYKPYIAIDVSQLDNPKKFARTVLHEAIHAALWHRLEGSAYFRKRIETLMKEFDRQTKGHEFREHMEYSLTNVHEFVSEAMSNQIMQQVMRGLSLDADTARGLGTGGIWSKVRTLWSSFVEEARNIMGFKPLPGVHNFLDETLKVVGSELEKKQFTAAQRGMYKAYKPPPQRPGRFSLYDSGEAISAAKGYASDKSTNVGGKMRRAGDWSSSLWMLGERARKFMGDLGNRVFEARAKQEHEKDEILKKYGGDKVTHALAEAQRKFPEAFALAKNIVLRASLHDVNVVGSNTHLGVDALMGVQAKKLLPGLQKEWADPAINPVRGVILDAMKFYKDIHDATARETIKNILTEGNVYDPALAERIFQRGLTDEDRVKFKNNVIVESLEEVAALHQRNGWYVPFRRYGEFISAAEHEVSVPANATKISDNTLQFTATGAKGEASARDMVKAYLEQDSHTPQGNLLTPTVIRKVWVDANDHSKILEKEEVDAVPAYRVSMQNRHVEFHDNESEALRNETFMTESGMLNARKHHRDQSYSSERELSGAMGDILRSLEKQQRYIDAEPAQKQAMREMFHELSLGLSSNTSVKNSMKQRRDVSGMSDDIVRVTADYARMTANHLAKLRHRPGMDRLFEEMRAYNKANQYDKDNLRRGELYQAMLGRIYGKESKLVEEERGGFITRLLQVSRLSKLAGPSFHIINAHEPWTTSMALIGGRHGFIASSRALKDAYSLIGARGNVVAGLKDMIKAYNSDTGFTDYVKVFKDEIAKSKGAGPDKIRRMQDMIDYLDSRNLYSNSSVFEIGKFANPEGNIAGRALDRADLMSNQVGQAIESINRTVTGLTAYNLEYKKNGGNHEAAMAYAYNTTHEAMGDYSHWNAAPIFNTQGGRLALQFKKFGHKTYFMLGRIMKDAIKGDPQAMKQFAGLMVTHGLVAGALGLPTEPFKVALMAANVFGATAFTPEDYDAAVRQLAFNLAGQKGGEIISKGLYRAIGLEMSGRLGLDSPLTQGSPRSTKANDLKAWLMDTVAGAAPAYLFDQIGAVQALAKGDVATFITKASPIRAVSDITKAIVGVSGPKLSPTGREQHEALSPAEGLARAIGINPARVAENYSARSTAARESRELATDRTAKIVEWVNAKGKDKVSAQRAVQQWNQANKDPGAQITQKDLERAARRRETEEETGSYQLGVKVDKRSRGILENVKQVYGQ